MKRRYIYSFSVEQATRKGEKLPYGNACGYLFDWVSPIDSRVYKFAIHINQEVTGLRGVITHVHSGKSINGRFPIQLTPAETKSRKAQVACALATVNKIFGVIPHGIFQARMNEAEKLPAAPAPKIYGT